MALLGTEPGVKHGQFLVVHLAEARDPQPHVAPANLPFGGRRRAR